MCVVPFGRDLLEVAGHVKAAGAGTVVQPFLLNPSRLRKSVREATSRRHHAQELAAALARAGGATAAATHLESLIRDTRFASADSWPEQSPLRP